jgi:high-affinity iron transporter
MVLVLREVLEAAFLVSLLMLLSRHFKLSGRWIGLALVFGLLGAAIYGFNIDIISPWFEGVGQEVVNASVQIAIYLLCAVLVFVVVFYTSRHDIPASQIAFLMLIVVMLAVVREGSEIMIYLSGFFRVDGMFVPVATGSIIGVGIGVSVGVVFYYALDAMRQPIGATASLVILALVAVGMMSQAAQLLIQADWLPSQYALWDSSWLVGEQSVTGQLLYALLGYEATPTPLQVLVYGLSLLLMAALAVLAMVTRGRPRDVANA